MAQTFLSAGSGDIPVPGFNRSDLTHFLSRPNRRQCCKGRDAVGTTRYDYTSFGALQSEDGPWADDTVTYSYSANRLRNGFSLAQPNASPWTLAYDYDAASRLSSVTSPAGTFEYQFGSVSNEVTSSQLIRRLGLPNGSAITNQFDERARWLGTTLRSSTGTLLNQHLYAYNDLDQRTKQTRAGGDFVDCGYDDLGQLKTAKGKEFGGTTNRLNEQFGYAYDAAGNLARRTNNLLVQSFAVNDLNQLSNATRSGTLTVAGGTYGPATSVTVNTLTADRYADHTFARTNLTLADGNNTFTAIATDSLSRSATNAITVNLPATVTFLYDLNGNLRTNGSRIFQYDDENQLICITEPGAWMCTNIYDGKLRRRIEKNYRWTGAAWLQTNEVRFVYDGNLVIQDRSEFNLPTLTLTRGLDLSGGLQGAGGIGGLLALSDHKSPVPEHFHFHADGNGNVTTLVDANESIAARYLYDPFGNTLSAAGPKAALNRYRFSSKPLHELSGMYDYLYRWYAPDVQRWLNRDRIQEQGGLNVNQFVRNEPIRHLDNNGLAVFVLPLAIPAAEGLATFLGGCAVSAAAGTGIGLLATMPVAAGAPPAIVYPGANSGAGVNAPPNSICRPYPPPICRINNPPKPKCQLVRQYINPPGDAPDIGEGAYRPSTRVCTYYCPGLGRPYQLEFPPNVPCPEAPMSP